MPIICIFLPSLNLYSNQEFVSILLLTMSFIPFRILQPIIEMKWTIHPSIPARIRKQLWRWYAIVWPDTISGCHYGWYCFCMMALQIFPPIAYNLASVPSYWSHKYLSSTQSLEMGAGDPIEIFVQQLCRMFAKLHCSGLRSRSENH